MIGVADTNDRFHVSEISLFKENFDEIMVSMMAE